MTVENRDSLFKVTWKLIRKKKTPTRTPTNHFGRASSYFLAKLVDRAVGSQGKHGDFQTSLLFSGECLTFCTSDYINCKGFEKVS